jgi:hypothetical protein
LGPPFDVLRLRIRPGRTRSRLGAPRTLRNPESSIGPRRVPRLVPLIELAGVRGVRDISGAQRCRLGRAAKPAEYPESSVSFGYPDGDEGVIA